jgi:hypothetical protein
MQHLEVCGAVRHIYIYIIRQLKVNRPANITPVFKASSHVCYHSRRSATKAAFIFPARSGKVESNGGIPTAYLMYYRRIIKLCVVRGVR